MAVEKGTHRALWVMATIGGLIILYLLLRKGGTVINQGNNTTGAVPPANVYNIASPGARQWVGGASGLPTISPLDDSDCGCTSINGGNFFTSINDMLSQFMAGSGAAFNKYENNVFNGYPTAMTQYFNNPVGAALSQQGANSFNGEDTGSIGLNTTQISAISGAN